MKSDGCDTVPHPCTKCGKEFALVSGLKHHAKQTLCSDAKKIQCSFGIFVPKRCLKKHKKICGLVFTCDLCGVDLKEKKKLIRHIMNHQNNGEFEFSHWIGVVMPKSFEETFSVKFSIS